MKEYGIDNEEWFIAEAIKRRDEYPDDPTCK